VTVHYATSNGTASAGKDYVARSGSVTFGHGAATATFAVPIIDDTIVEPDETVNLILSAPKGGATLGATPTATLTIHSDDVGGTLAFSSPTYVVSEVGATALVTVTRTGGAASGVTLRYATSDGTATAGLDYTAKAGTLSFGAGVTKRSFSVPIKNDRLVEGDQTVNLALTAPAGGAVLGSPSAAVLTITEKSVVNFTSASYSVSERTALAKITMKRTGGTANSVQVSYATSDGTAVAGSDYTPTSGMLMFPPGVSTASFTVPIVDDKIHEPSETVNLALSVADPGAVLGGTSTAILTIIDDDP
jgi:hypothetical protein